MLYATGILGILLAVAIGTNIYQYKAHQDYIEKTVTQITELKTTNKIQADTIVKYQEQRKEDQIKVNELSATLGKVNEELNQRNVVLDGYRNREATVLKRPGLIERRANRATKRVFRELRCATGADCNKDATISSEQTITSE